MFKDGNGKTFEENWKELMVIPILSIHGSYRIQIINTETEPKTSYNLFTTTILKL
jgi:hypothetical protein